MLHRNRLRSLLAASPDQLADTVWLVLMLAVAATALFGGFTSGSPAAMLASLLVAAMVYMGLRLPERR